MIIIMHMYHIGIFSFTLDYILKFYEFSKQGKMTAKVIFDMSREFMITMVAM